ncbi:MAG: CopG family antitoxin [Euryarchaeota archaeon]|nr:CopG family antitoxin [Euryarchaeota archaeon]
MMAKIPRFGTEQETRKFWDTHDSAEYFEDMKDDEVGGLLVIPMGEGHVWSLRGIALEEGVSSNVSEKLGR